MALQIVSTRNGVSPVVGYREDLAGGDLISLALSSNVGVTNIRWELLGRPEGSAAGGVGPEPILLPTGFSTSFTVDSDAGSFRLDGSYKVQATVNPGSPGEQRVTVILCRLAGITIPGPNSGVRTLRKLAGFEALEDTSLPQVLQGWAMQLDRWLELIREIASGGAGGFTTLAGAYSHGATSSDQTLVLHDALGGAVIVDSTQGDFTGASAFKVLTPGGNLVVDRATGRVGLGTASPAKSVHIASTAPAVRLDRTGGAALDVANVGDELQFLNGALVLAKLEPTGGLRADLGVGIGVAPATAPVLAFGPGSSAAVSASGTARFRYNEITGHAEWSENGGPYQPFGGATNAYNTIDDAGSPLTQRTILNVARPLVAVDNAGASRTDLSLSIDATLAVSGGALGRAALTGDVTAAAGSNATAFRSFTGASVLARAAGTSGAPGDLAATVDGQVLQRASGALTFAPLAYSSLTGLPTFFYQTMRTAGLALTQRAALNADGTVVMSDDVADGWTTIGLPHVGPGAQTVGGTGVTSISFDDYGRITGAIPGRFLTTITGIMAGGDLDGSYPNPQLAQKGAVAGQALVWNGTTWAPGSIATTAFYQTMQSIGLALPQRNALNADGTIVMVDDVADGWTTIGLPFILPGQTFGGTGIASLTVDNYGRVTGAIPGRFMTTVTGVMVGGDLDGSLPNPQISQKGATVGQALIWNGSGWSPAGASSMSALYYQTWQESGSPLTQRPAANASTGLTAVDNAGATRTELTVDLSTGVPGGQSAIGGTNSGENLNFVSNTVGGSGIGKFTFDGSATFIQGTPIVGNGPMLSLNGYAVLYGGLMGTGGGAGLLIGSAGGGTPPTTSPIFASVSQNNEQSIQIRNTSGLGSAYATYQASVYNGGPFGRFGMVGSGTTNGILLPNTVFLEANDDGFHTSAPLLLNTSGAAGDIIFATNSTERWRLLYGGAWWDATSAAAPASPATGHGRVWFDSTALNLWSVNSVGTKSHTVRTFAAVSHQFLTAVDDDGTVHAAQPAYADLTGTATGVTPGSYTNANLTVGADGRLTLVSNGSAGGSSFYQTVAGNGSAVTQRGTLNFSTEFAVVDNVGSARTDVSLSANGVGLAKVQTVAANSILMNPTASTASVQAVSLGATSGVLQYANGSPDSFPVYSAGAARIPFGSGTAGQLTDSTLLNWNGSSLGVGTATPPSTTIATFTKSNNGQADLLVQNTNVGVAAQCGVRLTNGSGGSTDSLLFVLLGSNFSAAAPLTANSLLFELETAGNFFQSVFGAGDFIWATTSSRTERMRITNAGAVRIAGLSAGGMLKAAITTGQLSIATAGTDYVVSVSGTAGQITNTGSPATPTLALVATGVTPGSYSNANITVGADGRITLASNGSGGATFYQTVDANGSALTQRAALNFSTEYSVVDNAGAGRTDVALAANGVALGKLATIAANSILMNPTASTASVQAVSLGTTSGVLQYINGSPDSFATYAAGSGRIPFGSGTNGQLTDSPALTLAGGVLKIGDGTTSVLGIEIATTAVSATWQFWKDATPSRAGAIGNGLPAQVPGNDVVVSTYNGAAWSAHTTFNSAGNVILAGGSASIKVPGIAASNLVATDGANFLTAATVSSPLTFSGGALSVLANSITYSLIQQESSRTLLGNPTGSAATVSEISIGEGISLSGSTLVGAPKLFYNIETTLAAGTPNMSTASTTWAVGSARYPVRFAAATVGFTAYVSNNSIPVGQTVSFTIARNNSLAGTNFFTLTSASGTGLFGGVIGITGGSTSDDYELIAVCSTSSGSIGIAGTLWFA